MPTTATTPTSTDRIEKQVTYDAPRSRVWRALTDVSAVQQMVRRNAHVAVQRGRRGQRQVLDPKYEQFTMTIWIETMEPERLFSFRWHPYAIEEGVDYAAEPTTLVTFTLEEVAGGTRLTIVESGFDAIPESRRAKAFSMNSNGWNGQVENIRKFLAA